MRYISCVIGLFGMVVYGLVMYIGGLDLFSVFIFLLNWSIFHDNVTGFRIDELKEEIEKLKKGI